MKCISIAIATLCLASASTASAQTFCEEIGGGGTSNSIAMFEGRCRVGNSSIFQSPTGNIGIGTTTPIWPLHVFSTNTTGAGGYPPIALWSEITAPDTWGAVYAVASSPTGNTIALNGEAPSPNGIGVLGQGGQNGVVGTTSSTNTFAVGAMGVSLAKAGGGGVGVFGQAWSADAVAAGLFANVAGGNIIVGAYGQPIV